MNESVTIHFNGIEREVSSATVLDLLSEFKLEGKKVAVELNREIVKRTAFGETKLKSGDKVEVVHFVGGG